MDASSLQRLLAAEYVLYVKTQNFHWNVVGPLFVSLHKLFGDQYTQLAEFIDRIAEQIRKYALTSPGSMREFVSLNPGAPESSGSLINGMVAVEELLESNNAVIQYINGILNTEKFDLATQELLGALLNFHLKSSWMLRSHLE